MKNLYSPFFSITVACLLFSACSKKAVTNNISNAPVLNGTLISNVKYGSNVDYYGVNQDLVLDVYKPNASLIRKNGKFPLYLWVHGGAFILGDKTDGSNEMIRMANNGFLAVAINYRLGWSRSPEGAQCSGDSTSLKEAIYRAIQDLNASLRYLVANADKYNIDTANIFVAGASAGGVTILNTKYITQDYASLMVTNAVSRFGRIDNADNNYTNTFTIKAMTCEWGGINDQMRITNLNAIPTIFLHGALDNVVPFNIGTVFQCPDELPVYGSKPLYNRLISLGITAEAYVDPNGSHGVYTDEFRSEKISLFLNAIMNKDAVSGFYLVDGPVYTTFNG